MLLPSSFPNPASTPTAKHLYRSYLQHVRLIPDPHVWSTLIPRFKARLKAQAQKQKQTQDGVEQIPFAESSNAAKERMREWKRAKALKLADRELRRLRAAVACHPHALTRLLEETYGQRGALRWDLLRSISLTYPADPPLTPLPPPLHPLRPATAAPSDAQPRARKHVPASAVRREAKRAIERDWGLVKPPIVLPVRQYTNLPARTGWETTPIVENLRLMAGFGVDISHNEAPASTTPTPDATHAHPSHKVSSMVDLSSLEKRLRKIFPRNLEPTLREPPLSPPRPKATRQNPTTWSPPRQLTDRLLRRTYRRLWESLIWVRPVPVSHQRRTTTEDVTPDAAAAAAEEAEERWKRCSYDEMRAWERGEIETVERTLVPEREGMEHKKMSKRQKARKAAESVISGDIKGKDKWSVAGEEDRRLLSLTATATG